MTRRFKLTFSVGFPEGSGKERWAVARGETTMGERGVRGTACKFHASSRILRGVRGEEGVDGGREETEEIVVEGVSGMM